MSLQAVEHGKLNDMWGFDGRTWAWHGGSNSTNAAGVYGTLSGVPTPGSWPGARAEHALWTPGAAAALGGVGYTVRSAPAPVFMFGGVGFAAGAHDHGRRVSPLSSAARILIFSPASWCLLERASSAWSAHAGCQPRLVRPTCTQRVLTRRPRPHSLSDLWSFHPERGLWTWLGGASSSGAMGPSTCPRLLRLLYDSTLPSFSVLARACPRHLERLLVGANKPA